jgi:signal transduction histidine kinase
MHGFGEFTRLGGDNVYHNYTVTLAVVDTGIGLDAEVLDRLFTPFTQADATTTRRFGGTGPGLAICRRLADLMDGRFWVRSEPGRGSEYHLEIPFRISAMSSGATAEDRAGESDTGACHDSARSAPQPDHRVRCRSGC